MISALSVVIPLLGLVPKATASPLALEETGQDIDFGSDLGAGLENDLDKRCTNPCGSTCCGSSQTCSSGASGSFCSDGSGSSGGGGGGDWHYWTTTYIVTEVESSTITSVMSSQLKSVATGTATGSGSGTCRLDLGESKCGSICCEASQECDNGQCVAESSSAAVTDEPTPGVRGTSSGAATVTQTSSPTTTQGFIAPVGTDGADLIGAKASSESSGGLSGGAIAGIVIGTIAGVILLLLLCGCLCFRGALLSLAAALGLRKRNRKDTTYVEERYSHHSHGSRPRPQGGRTWFGAKPHAAGTESSVSEKKSKWSGWGTVAIVLGALALCLGLKRHRDREHDDDRSSYTYPSTYYYSDYTRSKFDRR
ncbi:hypothetical protein N7512_002455 [Penicillium capsulatum]|nr:hypothetical protein N7512_002455 [Penicillium capsulatum]